MFEEEYTKEVQEALEKDDVAHIRSLAYEYAQKFPAPLKFLTGVLKEALMNIDSKQIDKMSVTDTYRLGKCISEATETITKELKGEYYDHLDINKKDVKILLVTFNDWHECGRILLGKFLMLEGYNTVDIGMIPSLGELVDQVIEHDPAVLAISVLMLNSALRLSGLREMLDKKGKKNVKIIAGGAPFYFDHTLYKRLKFDCQGETPFDAMRFITKHIGES